MEDKNRTRDGADALMNIAKGAVNTTKYLANTISASSLSLTSLLVMVLIFLLIICVTATVFPIQTLYTKTRISMEEVENVLEEGFRRVQEKSQDSVYEYIVTRYPSVGGGTPVFINDHFRYETENATISVEFTPELSEFAEKIDAYAQSVNATLSFFNMTDVEEKDIEIEENVTYLDENNHIELTDYGKRLLKSVDSEYTNAHSKGYLETLRLYSESIFEVAEPYMWIDKTYVGLKWKTVDVCYKLSSLTGEYERCACSLVKENDDRFRKEKMEVPVTARLGKIIVPMNYDPSFYKRGDMERLRNSLVGQEMAYPSDFEGKKMEFKTINSYQEACSYVEKIRSSYEMTYMCMYSNLEYGIGYPGQLKIMPNITNASEFWAMCSRGTELWNIFHPNGSLGPGERQCTLFVSVIVYLNYGVYIGAADGVNAAVNVASRYPDKYVLSTTPAPGAIVSFYPNHVLIVDEVTDSGGVYISEGNYDGMGSIRTHVYYNSINDYAKSRGWSIANIAIPRR